VCDSDVQEYIDSNTLQGHGPEVIT
jgi:hypothetical protein